MSRFFLVVLALFAIADVQVALARLTANHVNVPSRAAGHSKIRKAHHTRRHLAEGPFAGDAKGQLKVCHSFAIVFFQLQLLCQFFSLFFVNSSSILLGCGETSLLGKLRGHGFGGWFSEEGGREERERRLEWCW